MKLIGDRDAAKVRGAMEQESAYYFIAPQNPKVPGVNVSPRTISRLTMWSDII